MASGADNGTHWQVTLARHKKSKSVLYMEAGKEFVDLLLSFLTLPTSTVLKLIDLLGEGKRRPVMGISNVLESVHKLQREDFLIGENAATQLVELPVCADLPLHVESLIRCNRQTDLWFQAMTLYPCSCHKVFSVDNGAYNPPHATCKHCNRATHQNTKCNVYQSFAKAGFGFVERSVTYMITNNLRITRASTANITLLLAKRNVQSLSEVETCQVRVGSKEALQLLEASLGAISETLLTDIFPPEDQ